MPDQLLSITIPYGYGPGQQVTIQAPDGQKLSITVPPGCFGGTQIQVAVPKAAPAPPPAAATPWASKPWASPPATAPANDDDEKAKNLLSRCEAAGMTVRDYQVEAVLAECYGHAGRAWAKLVMRYGGGSKPETRKEVEGVSRDHFFRVPPNVPQQIKDLIVQPTGPLYDLLWGESIRPQDDIYGGQPHDEWAARVAASLKKKINCTRQQQHTLTAHPLTLLTTPLSLFFLLPSCLQSGTLNSLCPSSTCTRRPTA